MSDADFDFDRSRSYWRHVPSGAGKQDTSSLSGSDAASAAQAWDVGFRERFLNYPEEEQFLRTMAAELAGKRFLSIGSGFGFHELYYAAAGARVTCADIVESNIETITRVARQKRLDVAAHCIPDGDIDRVPGEFDVVFLYGSLMTMPAGPQRALLDKATRRVSPRGTIVLMLYSWEFVRRTCGWTSPSEFEPMRFARFSDPTVGDEDCPWSDWHDDAKLLSLAPPGMSILRRQTWNDEQYLWYELGREPSSTTARFFPPSALIEGERVARVKLRRFEAGDAALSRKWGGIAVHTSVNETHYAAIASVEDVGSAANAVALSIDLAEGACSIGVLDDDRNAFVANAVVAAPGRRDVVLLVPDWPKRARIVLSNHRPGAAASTSLVIRSATVLKRTIAAPPV